MIKSRLFTPGPVSVYPDALTASLDANIHHRTAEFKAILSDVMSRLKWILGNPDQAYLFASSGTGAMEAAVTNLFSSGEEVLVATCGKFGERWVELAQRFGLRSVLLRYEYGNAVEPEGIDAALKSNPRIRGVLLQACESSTGVQNDVDTIAAIVKKTDAILVVDAVSALATMPLSFESGIGVLVSGSQKALMIPPGLAMIGLSARAWKRIEANPSPRYYFDLRAARKAWEQNGQTAYTPATSLILSLRRSLETIQQWGLERLIQLTENRAKATRIAMNALSLEIFARRPANALTAVSVSNQGAEKITAEMKRRFGVHLAGGQGELKDKIFRISHMGYIDHFDLLGVLSGLEIVLKQMGYSITLGRSLEEFQKVYSEVA